MSLYNDLSTVLTPYANKIKQNESDIGDIQDALEHLDVETDKTLSVDGKPADAEAVGDAINEVKADLDNIIYSYTPTNYGSFGAGNLVVSSSAFQNKVTATDVDGAVSVSNSSGANGNIGFELTELPYDEPQHLSVKVKLTGATTPINMGFRYGMTSSASGTVYAWIVQNGDHDGEYTLNFTGFKSYSQGTLGNLFFYYNLRYGQTTPVTIELTITKAGDNPYTIVDTGRLKFIGFENISDELKDAITLVSGDTPTTYGGKQIRAFTKGVAIGDSLTAGVFNYNEGGTSGYATISAFSYPAKLEQMSGIDITNLGDGGKTSDEWWSAHSTVDFSGNQFAIIQLGVNDAIRYSGWTQTSITAFTNIINKLLTDVDGIFVFVSTIIPASSFTGTSYNAVSQGIRDLVESINNDHVILLDMAEYGNTNNETAYNNGHLSALGYDRLAQDYFSYISYVINNNPILFRNIQFIGSTHSYT